MTIKKAILAAACICVASGAAQAQTVTQTFTVNASDFFFTNSFGGPTTVPFSSLSGNFTIQYDPTVQSIDSNSIVSTNFNIPYNGALAFNYDPNSQIFAIGADTVNAIASNFDFRIGFRTSGGNVTLADASYSSNNSFYTATNTTVSLNASPSAVPEPASWAMMIGGFGIVGGSLRRRPRQALAIA